MTARFWRTVLALLVVLMIFSACGDDGTVTTQSDGTTAAPTTQAAATPTTNSPVATTATATSPPVTEAVTAVPAAERLVEFFNMAEELDAQIKQAADLFNDTFDSATSTAGAEAVKVIYALDAAPLAHRVPGGMEQNLEVAVLAVFADLDSRIAALIGGVEYGGDITCLGFGGESARRFPEDLVTAQSLALATPPPTVALDSPDSGMVAARLAYIQGSNTCCGSCGGYAYEETIEIDWEGRIFGPGWIDAPFVATFDGVSWNVDFPQAG